MVIQYNKEFIQCPGSQTNWKHYMELWLAVHQILDARDTNVLVMLHCCYVHVRNQVMILNVVFAESCSWLSVAHNMLECSECTSTVQCGLQLT